jgi:hypothetical protein
MFGVISAQLSVSRRAEPNYTVANFKYSIRKYAPEFSDPFEQAQAVAAYRDEGL